MESQLSAVITQYTDDDPSASIQVIHKDVPSDLKDGEVLVRMMLRPINPSDMFCMRGKYGGFTPEKLPAVPGLEGSACTVTSSDSVVVHAICVVVCTPPRRPQLYNQIHPSAAADSPALCLIGLGMVEKLGPNTGSRVKEGQRVVAVPWPTASGVGTYQQYVATPEKCLVNFSAHGISHLLFLHALCLALQVVVPDNVDDDMAAQFLVRQSASECAAELLPTSLLVVSKAGHKGCLPAWYPIYLQHTNAAEAVKAHDQTFDTDQLCLSTRLHIGEGLSSFPLCRSTQ